MTVGRSGALAFFAGLGNGYMDQNERNRQQAIEDARNKWQQTVQARQQAEWDRQDQQRSALSQAAAPVTMGGSGGLPDTMDSRDVGQPGEAPVAPATFNVAGKAYADRTTAQTAVDAANTPQAQMGRIASAISPFDPAQAATLRAQATQSQLADLNLTAAQRAEHNAQYDQQLREAAANGHQGNADFISSTTADGHDGKAKARVIVGKDGKVQYGFTGADGVEKVLPYSFTNDQQGATEAAYLLSRGVPESDKVKHNLDVARLAQEKDYQAGMLKNNAERTAMMGENAQLRLDAALARAGAGAKDPLDKMSDADKRQFSAATQEAQRLQQLIDKGTAEKTFGTVDPATKTVAYDPQEQAMLDRVRVAREQASKIAFKYEKSAAGGGDLGEYNPNASAPPAPPAVQRGAATVSSRGAPPPAPAAPARLAPTDFVAKYVASTGKPDSNVMNGVMSAATAGEQLTRAQQALRQAGASGNGSKIAEAAAAVQQAQAAYAGAVNQPGFPVDVKAQLASQYGGL